MKIRNLFISIAAIAMLMASVVSCSDDDDNNGGKNNGQKPSFTEKITTSVNGFVIDEFSEPLAGVTVTAGGKTEQTDENGYFEITKASLDKDAAFVTADKAGYFRGIRTWLPEVGGTQKVTIKMLPKTIVGSFAANAGGNVKTEDGAKLVFPADAIVVESSGAAYSGNVTVAFKWIDPSGKELPYEMPGDLRALDSDGYMQGLITYGMIAAELTGDGGQRLQIAKDKKVEMRMPIPASMQASAPVDMPLWFFDESKGLWIEEGASVKEGSEYVGSISHFSFWNCDAPYDLVYFKAKFVDKDGQPVSNATVKLTTNINDCGYNYTNSEGVVVGYIPKNTAFTMNVYQGYYEDCNELLTKNFGSTDKDIDLGTITVAMNEKDMFRISGTALDCEGNNLTNGKVLYSYNGRYFESKIENGKYKFIVLACATSINLELTIYNLDANKKHTTIFVPSKGDNVVPTVSTCEQTNYLSVFENGVNIEFSDLETYLNAEYGSLYLSGYNNNESAGLSMELSDFEDKVGTYNINYFYFYDNRAMRKTKSESEGQTFGTVTIKQFVRTEQGIIASGTFKAKYLDEGMNIERNVTGSFYNNGGLSPN